MTLGHYRDFSELPTTYLKLFEEAAAGNFFLSLAWFELIADAIVNDADQLHIFGLERGTPAVGPDIVLVMVSTTSADGFRTLSSLANFYTMLYAPIARKNINLDLSMQELVAELSAFRPRWDAISFTPLDPGQPTFKALTTALRSAGYVDKVTSRSGNFFQHTNNLEFTDYAKGLPSGIRRLDRKFGEAENIRFELTAGGQNLERAIADYETVYAASWKTEEIYQEFIPSLIKLCAAAGCLRLGCLYVDGSPAAAQLWIVHNRAATIYKLAYDEGYKKMGVGSMLSLRMMRHVIDEDLVDEVDFGSGDDKYKADWMSSKRERWGLIAYNPRTIRGLWATLRFFISSLRHRFLPNLKASN